MNQTTAPPPADARFTLEAPPEPDWTEAEAALLEQAEAAEEALRTAYGAWVRAVQEDLQGPLQEALRTSARRHRHLMEQAAFSDAEATAAVHWRRTVEYRQAVQDEVLTPIQQQLADTPVGDAAGAAFLELLQALGAFAEQLPDEEILSDPADLYRADRQDALPLRRRKAMVRGRRRLEKARAAWSNQLRRFFRKAPQQIPARSRTVPVRLLFDHHLHVRLPQVILPAYEALQQQTAGHLSALSGAVAGWTQEILSAESDLDRAAFHVPAALRWPEGSGPEAENAGPAATGAGQRLQDTAEALQQALEQAAAASVVPPEPDEERLAEATAALKQDLAHGGTFFLPPKDRALPAAADRPAARAAAQQRSWAAWHEGILQRLDLCKYLILFRTELLYLEDGLLARVAERMLQPLFSTFSALLGHFSRLREQSDLAFSAASTREEVEALVRVLHLLQEQARRHFQEALSGLPHLAAADQLLHRPAGPEEEQVEAILHTLPERLRVHRPAPEADAPVRPDRPARTIRLQHLAGEALSPPFSERLAKPAARLHKQLILAWTEAEQVQNIIQYNIGAAIDELEGAAVPGEAPGHPDQGGLALLGAYELASDSFTRSADRLTELAQRLYEPWQVFLQNVFEVFQEDWNDLHRRLQSDDLVDRKWVGFQVQFRRQTEHLGRQSRRQWQQLTHRTGRVLQHGQRRARHLIRRGQSAVGVLEASEGERLQTLDALTEAAVLHQRLPLIYRKLFSFEPVTEAFLLEGRTRDLERVRLHLARWQGAQTSDTLVLSVPVGSGQTSFLNVLRTSVFQEADVHMLPLHTRLSDESVLAARLAEALGLPAGAAMSLEDLEARLLRDPRPGPPRVCLIDNLEHLLLRAPGGTDLIERTLIFFSRTDTRVLWIAATRSEAWHFVERTARSAPGLATTLRLAHLDRADLEQIILNRHRRSGMPLHFAAPPDPLPLLRQRLRRAKTPEARQAVLRAEFFDRLYRLSGQNVMLALFYWLRAADFQAEEEVLTIRPLQPLNFQFFGGLDLPRAFSLQAFVQHHSLTLEEHNRIFRMTDAEGTSILESLLNLRIIEPYRPTMRPEAADGHTPIRPGERYRIYPLILHPVMEYLRSKHILY